MLFVAALAIASAACAREEVLDGGQTRGELRTFTCSFDEETQTKTDITKQGKTVWSEGDKIFVTNGTESDTLTVDSKFAGQRYFEFSTTLEGKIYVVYPCTAAKEVKDGKFTLEVPSEQNGLFGSANIACAVAKDRYVKMRNVTSVIRFKVDADAAAPVKAVAINTPSNNVAGVFSVDMTSGSPVVSTIEGNTYSSDVTVRVDGNNGNAFYATVIPGTYGAGLTMTAVTTDLHHASESKTTVSDKEFKVNAYYDLGTIGADLKPLAGEGTQGNPWQISTLADFLAFAYYVNDDHTMEGEFVKLMDNIKTVTTPVGFYDDNGEAGKKQKYFKGNFDGNGKTVTLNINQTAKKSCGLFGAAGQGANIHDVTVDGSVYSTFEDAAGICGTVNAGNGAKIINCTNKASVKTETRYSGGITGWANGVMVFDNCSNEGKIEGPKGVAGICGYLNGTGTAVRNSRNSGSVTTTESNGSGINEHDSNLYGVAGIVGWAKGTNIQNCVNFGTITCVNKAGGILGAGTYSTVDDSRNEGKIISDSLGVNAGIVGSLYSVGNVRNCENNGEINGARRTGWTGGIIGTAQAINANGTRLIKIFNCKNNGKITVDGKSGVTQGVGGIAGYTYSYSQTSRVEIYYCINTGDISVGNTGYGVAGIVGWSSDSGSKRGGYSCIPIVSSSNTGNISGDTFVGGILGGLTGYSNNSRSDLSNCENTGLISVRVQHVGGIFGGIKGSKRADTGARIKNCISTGMVQYTIVASKEPNAGGIAGYLAGGEVTNCYSGGSVKAISGTDNTSTTGSLWGWGNNASAKYSYYKEGICGQEVGSKSNAKPAIVRSVSSDGALSEVVSINSINYSDVVTALNAWVNVNGNSFYYDWTTGPKFSLTGKVSIGDGLDLGNGGKL